MVGVAGKSKGCTTCRRRKVKCDAARPSCMRCERAKLSCEGYERYPVFIDRTQSGYRKRLPLEEVKKPSPTNIVEFLSPDIEAAGLIASYWEPFARYAPSRFALLSPSHWLDHFLDNYASSPSLWHALLSVAVMRLSKSTNRSDLARQGRSLYVQSMELTRRAMNNPKESMKNEILATTCVLVLYELADSTSGDMAGWLNHLSGVARLMEHRGPDMHAEPAGRAILEHSRYILMLRHLMTRQSTIFSRDEWLQKPWQNADKSIKQQVFDYGLRLATGFDRCDSAIKHGATVETAIALVCECNEIYDGLQALQEQHISSVFAFDLDPTLAAPSPPSEVSYSAALSLSITALGIQLGACQSVHEIMGQFLEPATKDDDETVVDYGPTLHLADRSSYLSPNRKRLAQRILRYVACCRDRHTGAMGAARMIFCLDLALQEFEPFSDESENCQALLNQLNYRAARFDHLLPPSSALAKYEYSKTNCFLLESKKVEHDVRSSPDCMPRQALSGFIGDAMSPISASDRLEAPTASQYEPWLDFAVHDINWKEKAESFKRPSNFAVSRGVTQS